MQLGGKRDLLRWGERGIAQINRVRHDALDALDRGESAGVGDIRRLGRPGGNGARTRSDNLLEPGDRGGGPPGSVGQQPLEYLPLERAQFRGRFDHMNEGRAETADREFGGDQALSELLKPESGEGGRATKDQHGQKGPLLKQGLRAAWR